MTAAIVTAALGIPALAVACGIVARVGSARRRGGQVRVANSPPLKVYPRVPGPPPRGESR